MLDKNSLLISLIILLGCTSGQVKKHPPAPDLPEAFFETREHIVLDTTLLSPGDLILKCGYGPISKMIVDKLNEPVPISHCAVLDTFNHRWTVIHSLAKEAGGGRDGVQTMWLDDFLKDTRPGSLFILRHKGDPAKRKMMATRARAYLKEQRAFDYDFDLQDSTKLYCSELVYRCLLTVYKTPYFKTKEVGLRQVLTFNSLIADTLDFTSITGNSVTR